MSLGRGLDALITEPIASTIDVDKHKLVDVDIHKITPNAMQPRKSFNESDIDALSESIKRNGVLQPLILRPYEDAYEIIAGERRFRASKMAGLETVPAIIMNPDEQKLYEIALIENMQRVDLNPIEEALAFTALKDNYGMTQLEISRVVGKSRTYVANTMRLLTLDDVVKKSIENGKLTAGHAKVLVGLLPEIQRQMSEMIIHDELSVRELEKRIKNLKNPPLPAKKRQVDDYKYYEPFIKELEDTLGTKVDVHLNGHQSKINISFVNEDDFERLYNIIHHS